MNLLHRIGTAALTALILLPARGGGAQDRPYDLPSAIRPEDLTYSTGAQATPTPAPTPAASADGSQAWRTVDRIWPRGATSLTLEQVGRVGEDVEIPVANLSPEERVLIDRVESAAALDRQGQRDAARAELLAIFQSNPASQAAARAVYELALLEDDVSQAIAILERLATHRPNSAWATEAALKVGDYAMLINEYERAAVGYDVYLRRRPNAEHAREARMQMAAALQKLGRHDDALAEYEAIRAQGGPDAVAPEVVESVADSLIAQGRFAEAAQQIESIVRSGADHPNLPILLLNQGLCLEELGRYGDARGRYDYLKRRFPNNVAAKLAQDRLNDLSQPLLAAMAQTSVYMPTEPQATRNPTPPRRPTQRRLPPRDATPPALPRDPTQINPTTPQWPIEPAPRPTPTPTMRNMFDIDGTAVFPDADATGESASNDGTGAFPGSN